MEVKQVFKESSEGIYPTWRSSRLFGIYLSCLSVLNAQGELHPKDLGELEKVTLALNGKPFPEKVRFYRSLADYAHKDLYKRNFLEVGLGN